MDARKLVFVLALVATTAAFGEKAPKSAHANIVNGQGQNIGTAKISSTKDGVKIVVNVSQRLQVHTPYTFTPLANARDPIFGPPGDTSTQ